VQHRYTDAFALQAEEHSKIIIPPIKWKPCSTQYCKNVLCDIRAPLAISDVDRHREFWAILKIVKTGVAERKERLKTFLNDPDL